MLKDNDQGTAASLPFLALSAPGFSTKSGAVFAAREQHWCARTPLGLAVLSYDHVGRLLRDRRLRQGSYAWPQSQNAQGSFANFWQRSVISQEGAGHKQLRQVALAALDEGFILSLVPAFDAIAQRLCDGLKTRRECEFQRDFAMPFSGQAICVLLNLPLRTWQSVARDASTLGLAMGLNYKTHEDEVNAACDHLMRLADQLIGSAERGEDREGLAARLLRAAQKFSQIGRQELLDLIVILIFGGVDTTRSQLGFLMALFDRHPLQWQALKLDPSLVPNAIEEAIRAWPTTTWVTREATESFVYDGVEIDKDTTLHLLVHVSAKDPALGSLPEFDITVKQRRHHGFGGGAHHCLGHFVARTDMASALRALVVALEDFEIIGTPRYLADSGNTSPEVLPLAYRLAP